jgi:ubiquinone/menaquinone biosynthesis C-methylase UbiE
VTEIVAVEPEPYLREKASERADARVTVLDGTAEALPVENGSADAVVFSLVLCSVPSQAAALAEGRRILKPDGELRFYEHVVSHKPARAAFQRAFTKTLWKRMAAGCHMDRDTGAAIADAGFEIVELDRVPYQGLAHILGVAKPL